MNSLPAYIIMVSLLVPTLVKLGAVTTAAHMFAFYFAILSAITLAMVLASQYLVNKKEIKHETA